MFFMLNMQRQLKKRIMSDMYMLQSNGLDKFIADHVQADSLFLGCCGDVINTLVRHLHSSSGKLTPKEILKVQFLS